MHLNDGRPKRRRVNRALFDTKLVDFSESALFVLSDLSAGAGDAMEAGSLELRSATLVHLNTEPSLVSMKRRDSEVRAESALVPLGGGMLE